VNKRILYIAPFFNVPPTDGASHRAINLLKELAKFYQTTLLTYRANENNELRIWCQDHAIQTCWLRAKATYGGKSSFIGRLLATAPPGFSTHNAVGIAHDINELWQTEGPFDIIYFATQLMGQVLLQKQWRAKTIVDLYDVYTPIAFRKLNSVSWKQPYYWLFRLEAHRVRKFEHRILKQSDHILITSSEDREAVKQACTPERVTLIPNGVEMPHVNSVPNKARIIIAVGNYHYAPNVTGVQWFLAEVWPIVRRTLPDVRFVIVGQGGEGVFGPTDEDSSVQITGKVPELASYYECTSCAIIPIFDGGGTRLKLLEAMAFGVPVVATTKGAEGIEHKGTVLIADSAEAFAKAVIDCVQNPELSKEKAYLARQIVANQYTWAQIGQRLREVLSTC
jgi:glycosyltransferase involved in cell wall biosynthesis